MCLYPSTPLYNSPFPDSIPPVLLDLSKRVPGEASGSVSWGRGPMTQSASARRSLVGLAAQALWGSLAGAVYVRL